MARKPSRRRRKSDWQLIFAILAGLTFLVIIRNSNNATVAVRPTPILSISGPAR